MTALAAAANVKGAQETTFDEMMAWLTEHGLLNPEESLSNKQVVQQYNALSKCAFGKVFREDSWRDFLCRLLPCEARLAAK